MDLTGDICPLTVTGITGAETGSGIGAGLGGTRDREGGQQDEGACDSWRNAIAFE